MGRVVRVEAPAKVNLALDVLAKRPDGYHGVETVLQTVSLCDTVSVRESGADIVVLCDELAVPLGEDNLCHQAVSLLRRECGTNVGVEVFIEKRIPVAAGLGGGSADAAAVLCGLNELWSLGLDKEKLGHIGERVGTDVPFCLHGGTAFAWGRGERLEALPALAGCQFVIATPPVRIYTRWAYEEFDRHQGPSRGYARMVRRAVRAGDIRLLGRSLGNALEDAVGREHPIVKVLKRAMLESGALGAAMSGSGSSVFGLADSADRAADIAARLENWGGRVFTVSPGGAVPPGAAMGRGENG